MLTIVLVLGASELAESYSGLLPAGETTTRPFNEQQSLTPDQKITADASPLCIEPASPFEPSCDMLERRILASVVRYEIYGPSMDGSGRQAEGLGHGMVKDGRYLVVHNHFGVDLSSFDSGSPDAVITMYNGIGDLFMWKDSPHFTVVAEETEALVLDFGQSDGGDGFFETLGIPSAYFESWEEAAPHSGQIVAQVIWDGRHSDVAWTSIKDVILDDGTPRLILANTLLPGASGGGVLLDGSHIAVNWERGKHLDEVGAVIEEFSTAALNSSVLADIG
jgi:hypothetical protein